MSAKEGYLTKLGGKTKAKSWQKRWFVLRDDKLSYYEKDSSLSAKGVIDLAGAGASAASAEEAHGKDFCVKVVTGERTWFLAAEDAADCDSWIGAIAENAGDEVPDEGPTSLAELDIGFKEGFLTKEGGSRKNWNRRWFVLKAGKLAYYREKGDAKPAGEIRVKGAHMKTLTKTEFNNTFEVFDPEFGRSYKIYADSDAGMKDWMSSLEAAGAALETDVKELCGIGIILKQEEGIPYFMVESLLEGGPVARDGSIVPGNVITAIDGADIRETVFNDVLGLIRGEQGTEIEVTYEHEGVSKKVVLERNIVRSRKSKAVSHKQGWLHKRGGMNKSWKKRWVILAEGRMSYFKNQGDYDPAGSLDLRACEIEKSYEDDGRFAFDLYCPSEKRTYVWGAEDEREKKDWCSALERAGVQ